MMKEICFKKTGSTGVGEKDSNGKYHIIEYLQKFTETVNGVDVNFLGNEEQDANGNKYYKINKINDDNSKNISVTESDGTGGSYSVLLILIILKNGKIMILLQ